MKDSNLRYPCGYNTLAGCRFKPLSQSSELRVRGSNPIDLPYERKFFSSKPRNLCCPARTRTSILWTTTRCAAITPQDNLIQPICQRTLKQKTPNFWFGVCYFIVLVFHLNHTTSEPILCTRGYQQFLNCDLLIMTICLLVLIVLIYKYYKVKKNFLIVKYFFTVCLRFW